jgi:hypothetical protein
MFPTSILFVETSIYTPKNTYFSLLNNPEVDFLTDTIPPGDSIGIKI